MHLGNNKKILHKAKRRGKCKKNDKKDKTNGGDNLTMN